MFSLTKIGEDIGHWLFCCGHPFALVGRSEFSAAAVKACSVADLLGRRPPSHTGQEIASKQENQECLLCTGPGRALQFCVPLMLWEGPASAWEQFVSVTALRAVSKGKQGNRAVTGEGLLVEMLGGWAKGRLEVSLPEQDAHDAGAGGAVQAAPGSGTASWSTKTSLDLAQFAMYRVIV